MCRDSKVKLRVAVTQHKKRLHHTVWEIVDYISRIFFLFVNILKHFFVTCEKNYCENVINYNVCKVLILLIFLYR